MKRFANYLAFLIAAIAALALAVDFANVWLIRSSSGNTAYKMERLYANPEPDEIAIVGSSRACGNLMPSAISPRCFNYGVSGMGMNEVLPILAVLQARKTNAPIILNLDPWGGFGGHRYVADYRLAPQSGRVRFVDRMPGIRFFGALRSNLTGALDAHRSVTRVIDRGAQLLKNSRTQEEWAAIYSNFSTIDFGADEDEQQELISTLKSFAPRKVLVVISPCAHRWRDFFRGQKPLAVLVAQLKNIPNVEVLDYFNACEFDDSDFTDPTHFNVHGAERFSCFMRKFLISNLMLK